MTMKKLKEVTIDTKTNEVHEIDAIANVSYSVSSPTHNDSGKLTKEDVWGAFKDGKMVGGMIVARSEEKCPHFGDIVPYKSVTVVCRKKVFEDVAYWLEYVQGAECISDTKEIEGEIDLIAIRADYMCW